MTTEARNSGDAALRGAQTSRGHAGAVAALTARLAAVAAVVAAATQKVGAWRAVDHCEREFGDGEHFPVQYCGECYEADDWAMGELAKAVEALEACDDR
jgi:hypothetical protein